MESEDKTLQIDKQTDTPCKEVMIFCYRQTYKRRGKWGLNKSYECIGATHIFQKKHLHYLQFHLFFSLSMKMNKQFFP